MKEYLSWGDIDTMTDTLIEIIDEDYEDIFGIPRGGLPIAVMMSHKTGKELTLKPEENTLVIDDICDTGTTLSKYEDFTNAVLHYKENDKITPDYYIEKTENWIVYPWETEESSKMDYRE